MDASPERDAPDAGERPSPLMHWRELARALLERRWVAVAVFAMVFTAVFVWTFRQTPIYKSTARIQVDMTRQNVLNMPDLSGAEPFFLYNNYVNTLVREIQCQTFAERVAEALKAARPASLAGEPDMVAMVMRALDARPVKDSRLVDIVAEHRDPEVATLLANTAAQQVIAQSLDRRVSAASDAVAWLTEQVAQQRDKLAKSETALRDYRDLTRMVSLEQRQDIVVEKLKSINESLTAAELERVKAEGGWKDVEDHWNAGTNPQAIAAIATEPGVVAVRQQMLDKRGEAAGLASRYLEEHPAMKQVQNEVADLERKYTKACEEARSSIASRYALARTREEGLRQALREQEEQALALDRSLLQYDELKRNADADRELYDALLTRLKETDLAGKLETNNLRLSDRAHLPLRPYKPNKPANLARGAAAGLILGMVCALLVHFADDRVRRITLAGGIAGVPLLAVIPRIELPDAGARARAVVDEPLGAPAEGFRSLRASLRLSDRGRDARRIMITSTGAGEGKSLIAANLAIVLAVNGEKTLLIDCDLRRPAVRRAFPAFTARRHPLRDVVNLTDAVTVSAIPNLHILAPEEPLANPAELLASPRLARMLEEARGYDRVIIDSPPLFSVSDPLLLLPHVDGVILVARYMRTHQRILSDAMLSVTEHAATILGIVLNSVSQREHEYHYSGYYHYYGAQRRPTGWRKLWERWRGDTEERPSGDQPVASAAAGAAPRAEGQPPTRKKPPRSRGFRREKPGHGVSPGAAVR